MKKISKTMLFCTMAVILSGCGKVSPSTVSPSTAASSTVAPSTTTTDGNISDSDNPRVLVAYFSMPETDGVDMVAGASRVIVDGELYGNTEYIAGIIAEETGGTLFRIETEQPYPGIHEPLLDFADKEKASSARPELSSQIEDLDSYDIIYLGYPNWWADMPMPIYSFLEDHDFSGKMIVPFSTHGGSGFSNTIQSITSAEPDAIVIQDGHTVSRNSVGSAKDQVVSWLENLDL